MRHSVFTVLLPDKNLEEVFQLLSELKYDGVELRVAKDYHVSPDDILSSTNRLKDLMNQFKVEIPVLATYLSIKEKNPLLRIFEAADILGAKGVRVSLGSSLDGKRSYWEVASEVSSDLKQFVRAIKPFKAKAFFEIHFKTLISSPSLAYLLLKPFDPAKIGLIYDPANMVIEGREDWKIGIDIVRDYLEHVHVKNASWYKNKGWNWIWDELKGGMVDWQDVMKGLFRIHYTGYLSNENLSGVILPGATGFVGEQLSRPDSKSGKPIRSKLAEDLQFLKELEKKVAAIDGINKG
jgi:sugar phosphate isomerase/epimerase